MVAIVAAHPDDEVIGSASVFMRGRRCCQLIHITGGAPRDMRDAAAAGFSSRAEYAHARREELAAALSYPQIRPVRRHEMGVVDQEAVFHLQLLTRQLVALFRFDPPSVVITHAYEGGHPDHDAAAMAVHAARELLCREHAPAPPTIEMTSYHAGPDGIETGTFLETPVPVTTVQLEPDERQIKSAMLACFATQQRTLAYFNTEYERFRAAPSYRFTDPPHPGKLFYEQFS